MKKYIYLYIFLIPFLLCNFAGAVPTITADSDTHVVIEPGSFYNFSYTSDEAIITSHFFLDGVESTTGDKFKVLSFSDGGEYHNVSVYGTSATGDSNLITWHVTVLRSMATSGDVEEFSDDDYDNLTDQLSDGDWESVAETSTYPYTDLMGKLFYLVLFLLPFGIMWMKQQTMTIPVTLAMILGSVLIGFIPEQYKYFIILMIIMSFGVNLYLLGRDRA